MIELLCGLGIGLLLGAGVAVHFVRRYREREGQYGELARWMLKK
jgi:hypothetical protein